VKNFMIDTGKQFVLEIVNNPAASSAGAQTATLPIQHVARVTLDYSHFQLARDETWWWGVRQGRLSPDLDSHEMRVIPGKDTGDGMLEGYVIQLTDGGRSYRRAFTTRSMASAADRKILEILKAKESEISSADQYSYYITTVPADADDQPPSMAMNVKSCREPLAFQHAPLADYMARSKPLQGVSEPPPELHAPPMPIFVTAEVWQESKAQAFRGGEKESAALFSGQLFRDTDSPEVFLRVDACLEAAHADEEKLAVTFTGETWAHARELLELRRRRLNRPNEIIVGSVHRHPFLPSADSSGNRKCQACHGAKYCSRSTAVPSTDDFEWHRSVFSGQPYGIFLIWGYNAREEEDFRL
jgi:hypothetical protein